MTDTLLGLDAVTVNAEDVFNNLIAEVIFLFAISVLTIIVWNPIKRIIRRIRPAIDSAVPHVNCEVTSQNISGTWHTDISIKNSGKDPAYNIYMYLFEESQEDNYLIKSLGNQEIRSGVLGSGEVMRFRDKKLTFEGCNVTSGQEIWIDYDNSAGVSFRVIVDPPSPRGDDWHVNPPRIIRKRLPSLPGLNFRGKGKEWKKIRSGLRTVLFNPRKRGSTLWYQAKTKLKRVVSNG